jgi:hypothetical protein
MLIIGSVSLLALFVVSDWLMRNDDNEGFVDLLAKAFRQMRWS